MRHILILGAGNIGHFMGFALQNENTEVKHLVRNPSSIYPPITCAFMDLRQGKKIRKGTIYRCDILYEKKQIPEYEYILVPVGHFQWRKAILDLKPYLHNAQTLVLMGNIWDDFDWFEQELITPYIFAFPNFGGAINDGKLKGWLTRNLVLGLTSEKFKGPITDFLEILRSAGFSPKLNEDIEGWHKTHFAWMAGTLAQVARHGGYKQLSKNFNNLKQMFALIRECMEVVESSGIDFRRFREGRRACLPLWWNALRTFLLFRLPGLASTADTTIDLEIWSSYGLKVLTNARNQGLRLPLLETYHTELQRLAGHLE